MRRSGTASRSPVLRRPRCSPQARRCTLRWQRWPPSRGRRRGSTAGTRRSSCVRSQRINVWRVKCTWRCVRLVSEVLAEVLLRYLPRRWRVCARHWFQRLEDGVVERRRATKRIHCEHLVRNMTASNFPLGSLRIDGTEGHLLVETEFVHEAMALDVVRPEDLRSGHSRLVRNPG